MLTIQAAVQAAFVAGMVSLLVTWLNNYFARQNTQEAENRKRQNWFLEKQARDAEEIILALDNFIKVLANDLSVVDDIDTEMIVMFGFTDVEPSGAEFQHVGKLLDTLNSELAKNKSSQDNWFTYDAPRLSVWFTGPLKVDKRLERLNDEFYATYSPLVTFRANCRSVTTIAEYNDNYREKVQSHLLFAQSSWRELLKNVHTFQVDLIHDFRLDDTSQPSKSVLNKFESYSKAFWVWFRG